MTAETCGRSAMPANVAPPLKSTSTKLSASGEWVSESASTRVRSSSDLPEPVAPMTSPCGPMPCWADSLMSSATGPPSASDADRHPQPVALQPGPPGSVRVEVAHVALTEQVDQLGGRAEHVARLGLVTGVPRRQPAGGRLGPHRRELVGRAVRGAAGQADDLERHGAGSRPAGQRLAHGQAQRRGRGQLAPLLGQVEHGHAEHAVRGDHRVARRARRRRRRRAGRAAATACSLGPNRGRSTISGGSSGSRSCTDSPTSRTGPTASRSRGLSARAAAT